MGISMKMFRKTAPLIGFTILSGMVMLLLAFTVFEAWVLHAWGGILVFLVMIGVLLAVYQEGQYLWKKPPENDTILTNLWDFLAVFVGALFAFTLCHDIGLGAVVAASLVAIMAQLIFPEFAIPAYCGAFVGMTSNNLLYTHTELALAAFVAGLIYLATKPAFAGYGGKLGTIALIGTVITGLGLSREFVITPIRDWQTNLLIILIALIATPLTFYLNVYKKNGPVMASALVGLTGGLILPILFPETGQTLAVVMICASFTGMSAAKRCLRFWHIVPAGLVTGIIFIYSAPLLGGAGGKLGTIAFSSVLSFCGYLSLFQKNDSRADK